jgi:hypothetical protein
MNKNSTGKYTKEKYNLKNRKLPFLVRVKNNWQRMKKHNVHKSFDFLIACFLFGLFTLKGIQFYLFAKAFLIKVPREEFQKNHLMFDFSLKDKTDHESLNKYLDKLVDLKLQRENEIKEKQHIEIIDNIPNKL